MTKAFSNLNSIFIVVSAATFLAGCAGQAAREGNLKRASSFTLDSLLGKPSRPPKPRRPRVYKPRTPKPSLADVTGNPAEENLRKGRFDPLYEPRSSRQ